jgi:hypothetical protein
MTYNALSSYIERVLSLLPVAARSLQLLLLKYLKWTLALAHHSDVVALRILRPAYSDH